MFWVVVVEVRRVGRFMFCKVGCFGVDDDVDVRVERNIFLIRPP